MSSVTINGNTYTDDSNPTTGLAAGGHRTRFIPLISDVVVVSAEVENDRVSASTFAGTATIQAGIATTQAGLAATQVGLATAQVGLATTQAGNASVSAAAALVSQNAAAVSAAAALVSEQNAQLLSESGLPSQVGNDGKALTTNGTSTQWTAVQAPLVSGVNIKTINNASLLASGDIFVGIGYDERTSNTALSISDSSKLIDITSGTFTQTFAACSTLGERWFCYLRNSGTGDITLDPNGGETIDGLTSFIMYPGETRLVQCNGSALQSVVINSFYKVFTNSGSFVKPPGYSIFSVKGWAGGGSGRKDSALDSKSGGSGGACIEFTIAATALGNPESVTIGAGGLETTVNATNGNPGGNTVFAGITAFGGSGGQNASVNGGSAYLSGLVLGTDNDGYRGGYSSAANQAEYGGAASLISTAITGRGITVHGGGGGGGISNADVLVNVGSTVFGGAGGAAVLANNGTNGTVPGGGGGATKTGAQSGAGARGELRIWGMI